MKTNKITKALLITLSIILAAAMSIPGTAEAAGQKAVKSVSLNIGAQQVAKKTYSLPKGKAVILQAAANPLKAKKSVSYKSSNKKIVTVSKKGKITAKKTGTAKVTVTVKGKNGKKKTTWVKVKVTAVKKGSSNSLNGHKHSWQDITQQKYVVDVKAYDEDVYEEKYVCYGNKLKNETCDFYCDTYDEICKHIGQKKHSYGIEDVKVGTIHHDEEGHYKTVVIDRKCKICGVLDSQL